jgi:hypothetical protein
MSSTSAWASNFLVVVRGDHALFKTSLGRPLKTSKKKLNSFNLISMSGLLLSHKSSIPFIYLFIYLLLN